MSVHWFFVFLRTIFFFTSSVSAQQHYDSKDCAANSSFPGSRYTCNKTTTNSCETFVIFRANQHFNTLETVSELLQPHQMNESLQNLNRISSNTEILEPGREIFIPVTCSCSGQYYFQTDLSYTAPEDTSVVDVACSVFESLVTYRTIMLENQLLGSSSHDDYVSAGTKLHIPLKCACPSKSDKDSVFKFLATYPVFEGDSLSEISDKFGISSEDLFTVNGLDQHWQTIFPNTTLLIPFKSFVLMNKSHSPPPPPPPTPTFLPTNTIERPPSSSNKDSSFKSLYIAGSVIGFFLVVAAMFAFSLYVKSMKKEKIQKLLSFNSQLTCSTPKSSATGLSSTTPPCLSPDLLVGILYSLRSYTIEELRRATNDFCEKVGSDNESYIGVLEGGVGTVMVKPLRFEDIRQVIDVHSRINHINIVTLVGVCHGDNEISTSSYILLEFPSNGCLRDCILSNSLCWHTRTQIAFDIASGLHYLHDCIFPSYAHMSVNSRNVYVTSDWRAKLTNIRITNSVNLGGSGWLAPEYNGLASEKIDIFAFGVVLLELISGREDESGDGRLFKESLGFLGGGEGGCFEQLRGFIDPCLEGDYPLAEALCLAVLAKTCVEDDPLRRPSMDDILKVLVRMV